MGLLPDTKICGLLMRRECRERFLHILQRKPLVSEYVPWWMSRSLTRGSGENVPGIPGACATHNLRICQEAHKNARNLKISIQIKVCGSVRACSTKREYVHLRLIVQYGCSQDRSLATRFFWIWDLKKLHILKVPYRFIGCYYSVLTRKLLIIVKY